MTDVDRSLAWGFSSQGLPAPRSPKVFSQLLHKKPAVLEIYVGVVKDGLGGFPLAGLTGALLQYHSSPTRTELFASNKVPSQGAFSAKQMRGIEFRPKVTERCLTPLGLPNPPGIRSLHQSEGGVVGFRSPGEISWFQGAIVGEHVRFGGDKSLSILIS
eukprot:1179323-Prorocentrum_minimum.AAC.4